MMEHTGTNPDIPILFEDTHLLVIDKPHGLLSQQDRTGDPDVLSLCKQYLTQKQEKQDSVYLGLVHRLDRPVGGVMLLAKTPKAAGRLSKMMRDRVIRKTYRAVVQGIPPENGLLNHFLLKNRRNNTVEAVSADTPDAAEATLSFQKHKQAKDLAMLSIHLQTGRPHQIRVQLAEEGFPIWGDYKYGLQQPDGRTMALRAVELEMEHPVGGEEIRFEAPVPDSEPWNRFH